MEKIRTFIAVDIPVSQKIKDLIAEIKKTGVNAKLVEPENIHITLKFLGDTNTALVNDIEKIIKESTDKISPFEIKLRNVGVFPNTNYIKVFWIGVENTEILGKISKEIDRKLSELDFEKERREFSAHLTIARIKSAKNKEKILQLIKKYNGVEFQNVPVDRIILKKSQLTQKGPIYTNIREITIGE